MATNIFECLSVVVNEFHIYSTFKKVGQNGIPR